MNTDLNAAHMRLTLADGPPARGLRLDPDAVGSVVAGHRAAEQAVMDSLSALHDDGFGAWAHTGEQREAAAALRGQVRALRTQLDACAADLTRLTEGLSAQVDALVAADAEVVR